MDRSLFPDGIETRSKNLENTEETKKFHIIKRHTDTSNLGVIFGCEVTINVSDNTLIDIAIGDGYVPNGEYLELSVASNALSLADYTIGEINYVVAIYIETNDDLEPHETNGESFPTEANRDYRIRILSETEFNALPDTDDVLSNDALDRALILAKITAQGIGVTLTLSNITLPTTFGSAITATYTSNVIAGVSIAAIDRTTPTGVGQLSFTVSGSLLTWAAPDDSAGASVNIGSSGTYSLLSANGKTITIVVVASNLPSSNTNEFVTISNVYTQLVNRFSSEDLQHRSFVGSGTPTANNPHGLNPVDLGVTTDAVEIHQDLFHSNGVLKTSNANIFEAIINVNTSPHSLDINPPIGGDVFYINGVEYNGISNTVVTWTDVTIAGTPTSQGLYDIYALEGSNGIASIVKERRAEYNRDSFEENAAVNNYLADNVQLRSVSKNFEATNLNLRYLVDDKSLAIEYSGSGYGTKEFLPDDNLPDVIRLYNATREYWIEVYAIDQGSKTAQFTSNENEVINIFALPDQEARLLIASVVFSGTGTSNLEYLGGGFTGGLHKPNTLVDYGQIDLIKIDNTISGIRVLSISRNVPEGIGSLEFTLTGTLLAWGAAGESAGTGVDVSSGGVGYPIFEISSTTPEYILKVQSYNADLPGSNQTDIFEIKTDETYFGIVGRDDLRGDVDSFLRDLELSKQGKYKRTLFKTVEDRLFASSFIVTVGTGYGVSIGDYNVKDFDDAATCINRATSDLRFSSENGGGIISIKSGTYIFDTASVILLHDKISLIGEHKNAVIFTKNTSTNQIINSITSHNTIKNITFTLDGSIGITTLLDFDNSHVKIIDCDFIVNVQPSAIVTIIVLTASANYTTIRDCTFTIDGTVTQNVGLINFASAAVRIQDCTFDGNTDEPVIIGSASTADSARIVNNDFINIDNGSLGNSPISIQGSYCHILHNNMLGTGSVQAITVTSSGTYNIITNNYVSGLRIGISAGGPSNIVHSNIFLNCQFGGMLFDEGGCIAANNIILGTATSYGISATSNASKTIVNGNRIDSIGSTATAIDMNGADKIISNNIIDVDEHGIEASREGTIISSNLVDSLDRGIYIEANTAIDLTAVVIGNVCVNQDSIASQTGAITFLRSNTGARINGTIIGNVTLSPLDGIFIEQTGGTTTLEDAVVVVGIS